MKYIYLALATVLVTVTACTSSQPLVCPKDAMLCADGSTVGRTGPDCEFAACPDAALPTEQPVDNTATDSSGTPRVGETVVIEKKVIGEDPDKCMRIKFACAIGYEHYNDGLTCGCVLYGTSVVPVASDTVCTTQQEPVCGWFSEDIRCFAYPCAQTYSNACEASKDSKVASISAGECPNVVQEQTPTEDSGLISKYACSEPRPTFCTKEYVPVCGSDGQTYGNGCSACANATVDSYVSGACGGFTDDNETRKYVSSDPKSCTTLQFKCAWPRAAFYDDTGCGCQLRSDPVSASGKCTEPRPTSCSDEEDPVCGRSTTKEQTFANSCLACSQKTIREWTGGVCS